MSQSVHPPKPTGTARTLDRGPSLRWRIRRWILKKLDAWPREKSEPTTEWGRLRRRERRRLVEEVERLRALEDRLMRWRDYAYQSVHSRRERDMLDNLWCFVVEGKLDEMLAEFARDGDELAAEYVREGS